MEAQVGNGGELHQYVLRDLWAGYGKFQAKQKFAQKTEGNRKLWRAFLEGSTACTSERVCCDQVTEKKSRCCKERCV